MDHDPIFQLRRMPIIPKPMPEEHLEVELGRHAVQTEYLNIT
jgi:hypothetical protein